MFLHDMTRDLQSVVGNWQTRIAQDFKVNFLLTKFFPNGGISQPRWFMKENNTTKRLVGDRKSVV